MRTWDRLRPLLGEVTCRGTELEEPVQEGQGGLSARDRLCALWVGIRLEFEDRSCCKPALTAAAACKETEAVRLGVGEVEPSGCRDAGDSLPLGLVLADIAEADEDGGGGGSEERG